MFTARYLPTPSSPQITGGRNGFGAKLANIFSTEFTIETCDGSRQRKYKQTFANNMQKKGEPKIMDCKVRAHQCAPASTICLQPLARQRPPSACWYALQQYRGLVPACPQASDNWTCITFKPDLAKFGLDCLDEELVSLLRRRVYDMAGVLGKGTKVRTLSPTPCKPARRVWVLLRTSACRVACAPRLVGPDRVRAGLLQRRAAGH